MLITSTCLILASIASPASAQPMSPPQAPRLSCNFLTCTGSILGESLTLLDNLDNLSLQVQLRLVSTPVQPRRCSSVWRTSWTALARETARLASATLYQAFVRARMWSLLRQNLGKYLTLNPNWRLRKILTWGVTFSHALDPSWVRSDLNKKKKNLSSYLYFLEAVKTCLHTGSAEEVLDCVKNILDSIGQGDCKECICDIIPSFCKVWNINLDLSLIPPASF